MAELTRESARAVLETWDRSREVAATEPMSAAEKFAVNASPLGLTEKGFDWQHWGPYIDGRYQAPEFIAQADTQTLRRIATTHFRLARFVGGHMEAIDESGVLQAIVNRLRDLVETHQL